MELLQVQLTLTSNTYIVMVYCGRSFPLVLFFSLLLLLVFFFFIDFYLACLRLCSWY